MDERRFRVVLHGRLEGTDTGYFDVIDPPSSYVDWLIGKPIDRLQYDEARATIALAHRYPFDRTRNAFVPPTQQQGDTNQKEPT